MENTREKNKRADGRKKTYFDRENKKKAARTEKTKSVAPEKGKQKKSSSSSKCPYQKKCGGCTYLNLSYEEQLAKKEQFLKKTLKGIVPVKGMVGMENPYHYRNKVNSAFKKKKEINKNDIKNTKEIPPSEIFVIKEYLPLNLVKKKKKIN